MRLSMLMALRTQLDAMSIQVDGLIAEEQHTQEGKDHGCAHRSRIDLRVMGEQEHWRCRECGHECYVPLELTDGAQVG